MGFDVSYHPVSTEELQHWCIERLPEIKRRDTKSAKAIAKQIGLSKSDTKSYLKLLSQIAKFDPQDSFAEALGFGCAAIQGMFRNYYYTRNSGLTDLIEQSEKVAQLSGSLERDLGLNLSAPKGLLEYNYSAGAWFAPDAVKELLSLIENDTEVQEEFSECFPDEIGRAHV